MAEKVLQAKTAAIAAHQAGDLAKAARLYASYLMRVPDDAGAWSNLGALHRKQGRHSAALRAHERAFSLAPEDQGVLTNLANVLSDLGAYDRSIELRRKILTKGPDNANHKAMIGRCYRGKGAYQEAIDYLTSVIADHPGDPELQMQLAFAQLGAGDYRNGLETYKARWDAGELQPRKLPIPEWQGEPLAGKTIAVLPEQGFGDAVLFARFLNILSGLGATVKLVVKKPLRRLFSQIAGVDQIISDLTAETQADFWVNMMDLAALYFQSHDDVPVPARLHIPQSAKQRAAEIIKPFAKNFRVGVVWTGSVTYKGNAFRSFTHDAFLPLADIPGVQLFSLYKGPELASYYADGTDAFLLDAGSSEEDFADCAAMMQAMDLVITSDTATAHIAGSLAVPTWTVLHWDAFWVWRHFGETTSWYPKMRLFRQKTPLDWGGVMQDVQMALAKNVKGLV